MITLRMCMSCHCFVILLRSANHIFQTSQVEESKIRFHTIGKNKTTPDGTDESNFHSEAEMRHNADYTGRVCQSLVASVAESSMCYMSCRFLFEILSCFVCNLSCKSSDFSWFLSVKSQLIFVCDLSCKSLPLCMFILMGLSLNQ